MHVNNIVGTYLIAGVAGLRWGTHGYQQRALLLLFVFHVRINCTSQGMSLEPRGFGHDMNTLKCRLQAKEDDGSENGEDDAEGGEVSFFFFGNSLSGDGTLSDLSFRDRFSNVCIFFAETDRPR